MNLISTDELRKKLERRDDFKLVMTFHPWAFEAKHIPGSLNVFSRESAAGLIDPSDEIVVYCVNEMCQASATAYHIMHNMGFKNVRRYAGGLEAWEAAGFELEGEHTKTKILPDDSFMKHV